MSVIGEMFRAIGRLFDIIDGKRRLEVRTRFYCEHCDDNIRPGEIHYSNCPLAERE